MGFTRRKLNKRSLDRRPSQNSSMASSYGSSYSLSYRKTILWLIFVCFILGVVFLSSISSSIMVNLFGNVQTAHLHTIEVVNVFPHDPKAFTQGLLYAGNDGLFESTGLYGQSSVRRVALQTGEVEVIHKMDDSYFGEGLTLFDDRLYQVTWLTNTGFLYEKNNLSKTGNFTHGMKDGWGLATDGKVLFGSDGTSTLYHLDPQTLKVTEEHIVKFEGHQIHNLNELEYVNDEVWANIWGSDCIARISYKDGNVVGWVLLQSLREELISSGYNYIDVLNGIAWDRDSDRLFVTGKLWPKMYEIKLHPVTTPYDGDIKKTCMKTAIRFSRS